MRGPRMGSQKVHWMGIEMVWKKGEQMVEVKVHLMDGQRVIRMATWMGLWREHQMGYLKAPQRE